MIALGANIGSGVYVSSGKVGPSPRRTGQDPCRFGLPPAVDLPLT
jgi:hypothetical protein